MKNLIFIIAFFFLGCGGGGGSSAPEENTSILGDVKSIAEQPLPGGVPSALDKIAKKNKIN